MQLAADPRKPRRFLEHEGYQVQYLPESGIDGLRNFHFVVKRSYRIEADQPARPRTLQRVLQTADAWYDDVLDPLSSPVRYETDLVPPKPGCDVVLNGHCHAPGGEQTTVECRMRVAEQEKRVLVLGDRSAWKPKARKTALLTPARPFNVMPLRWDLAYGGVDRSFETGPMPHPANPSGRGYWAAPVEGIEDVDRHGPLPNIENPASPIQLNAMLVDPLDWRTGPHPWGFGWVPKHWSPRAEMAGMDPALKSLWETLHGDTPPGGDGPLPFMEMQPEFLNGAPLGQVIPFPQGGELVMLDHLHPTHEQLRFRLPADRPRLRWDWGEGAFEAVPLQLDTVLIEPDIDFLDCVWRGTLPAPEGYRLDEAHAVQIEVDGALTMPAQLLDTGFPIELLTEGRGAVEPPPEAGPFVDQGDDT